MRKLEDRVEQALILGFQEVGRQVFARSQRRVPVRTGRLKASGYVRHLRNGAEVGYAAPYAFAVNSRLSSFSPSISGNSIFNTGGRTRPSAWGRGDPHRGGSRRFDFKEQGFLTAAEVEVLSRWPQIVGQFLKKA